MVKVRTLVPVTHPTTDEQFGANTEVDVADDVAQQWRAAGKASLLSDEKANAEAAGHYHDVTTREDVAPLGGGGTPQPGPQASDEDEEDQPRSRRGKK